MHGDLQAESSGWLSSHHLQGAGAYCGGPTTGCRVCFVRVDRDSLDGAEELVHSVEFSCCVEFLTRILSNVMDLCSSSV